MVCFFLVIKVYISVGVFFIGLQLEEILCGYMEVQFRKSIQTFFLLISGLVVVVMKIYCEFF